MACTGCAKQGLVAIRMRIGGREIVFRRCNRCEANVWEDATDGVLTLDRVLELARTAR